MSKSNLIKNNKVLIVVISVLLVMIVFVNASGDKHKQGNKKNISTQTNVSPYSDRATGDNTAESLDALTQQLHAVIGSNKELKANNSKLNKKNAGILENIRQEVGQSLDAEMKKRGQDNHQQIAQLQETLSSVNAELSQLKKKQEKGSFQAAYSVDAGQNSQLSKGEVISLEGAMLSEVPDLTAHPSQVKDLATPGGVSLLHPGQAAEEKVREVEKEKPYYTIPTGATLADSVTMTSLIGRVPVGGVVKSPYPFKIIIGSNNLAANGLHIPGISGAIIQGITVGDMALRCVKGYVTAVTFIFPDGTISTTQLSSSGDSSSLDFSNSIGYLSQPNGNPCFPGKFYTNAPTYLSTMVALGSVNQGGQAYSQAQQTSMTNSMGGTTSSLTGSIGKFMLGGAVAGGTSEAMHWFSERQKNSFDAVYVKAGKKAVINITKQIAINYNPSGRKLYYEHKKRKHNNTSLD